jgi:hypothetical protein
MNAYKQIMQKIANLSGEVLFSQIGLSHCRKALSLSPFPNEDRPTSANIKK